MGNMSTWAASDLLPAFHHWPVVLRLVVRLDGVYLVGHVTVYTDGSCIGNPGAGGWAWAISKDKYACGSGGHTTNNRMEIMAVLEALRAHPGEDMTIYSDSKYVVDCLTQRWFVKWQRNDWTTSSRTPVLNRELWQAMIEQLRGREVRMVWVRGHAGDVMNNFVDGLARRAASK